MARYTANDGVVTIGGTAFGNVRSWELNETGDEIDMPAMGDSARVRLPGKPDVGGSLTAWFDDGDAVQAALDQGDTIALIIQPRGVGSGLPQFSLTSARVSGVNWRGNVDAGLEIEFNYTSDALSDKTAQA